MSVPATAQLGMTANVLFNSAMDAKLVLLPLAAIANTRPGADPGQAPVDEPAVWVVDPKTSQVKLRRVKIGQFREDGVTITSGLEAGEVVVTAGVHKLKPDQVVRRVAAL
jgi:multidrug efflux pump subunit AcrA (membrane-fusion protein)